MPSSDPVTIPKVLDLVFKLSPRTILDVGSGNARYGFLFREILDWNYGRMDPDTWQVAINAVEVDESYLTPVHRYVYNEIAIGDWMEVEPINHDVIFMGDVLEHFEDWESALNKAKDHSAITIVAAPNWKGSIAQDDWFGHKHESHLVELSPEIIGGKCLFANSKCFISAFGDSIIENRDILL